MSQFTFLQREWAAVFEAASKAEGAVHADPRTACFYARRALELAVSWAFKHDASLRLPYQDNLSALIHEPSFKQTAGEAVFSKARVINTLGNRAVHSHRPVPEADAVAAVRELFHVAYWFARTYGRTGRPAPGLAFDPAALPRPARAAAQTAEQLQALEARLREKGESLAALLADKTALDEELTRLRAEVAKAKQAAAAQPDTHDYSEAETRDYFIDLLLKEAGWPLDQARDREFEVTGMPNAEGKGFVDYVLWGDDGKPLALVEAKRTRRDPRAGQQQAKLYADCLERQFGRRPVIFYSNGYEHWLWDDTRYPPRRVQGFYKRAELELLIQRRETRRPLAEAAISPTIVERHYQTRAIRRIAEAFERDHDRKALLVMATGAGKTRTVIALCDLLMRCNWAKRVLFLADRVALVNQAVNAFKRHLPDASPVNLVTEKTAEGRVYVSTYPTMMGLIDEMSQDRAGRGSDGQRRFGVGHFDLVIIDEAHRSVFQKYRAIFDYFDSLLVGLTATPKDEVDRNTYRLFDLEDGVPTDAYSLEEAVHDGFLVPPQAVSVPLKFQREGIKYDELSEEDKEQWDALEWDDEGDIPDRVEAEAVNRWLFNQDTVDKVLEHLMRRGQRVAGGDRLGKTIIFAKNQQHAEFIAERFDANYPHLKGAFARVITFKTEYAQSLIEDLSIKDKAPHIAISVDMLDTGIDIPEVANLVFFKLVRSKTKFWQMLGRGTRLCPDLFGPGRDKEFFYLFDYCQNLEYFSQDIPGTDGYAAESLAKRLFDARLELIVELDRCAEQPRDRRPPEQAASHGDPVNESEVRRAVAELLQREVAAMKVDNFIVRPHRRLVEMYADLGAWTALTTDAIAELSQEVAGLPTGLAPESEEARFFDLIVLKLQLAILRSEPTFGLQARLREIAGLLAEKDAIPSVREQMALIQDVLTDEWWQDVTVPMLESMRRRLRGLVHLIDKRRRRPVYTDFEDSIGQETHFTLSGSAVGIDQTRFIAKARAFLQKHLDHLAVAKLRLNRPLTSSDLSELERLLGESGVGEPEDIRRAAEDAQGLGLFVRSLVGMDRVAAKQALASFTEGKTLTANQLEFVNLIVEHLTEHGVVEAARLYESPFTDLAPHGPDDLFASSELDELMRVLNAVRAAAIAA
ncbi:MAG: DEAD/DEAH box helicase family protein [Acidobacteria bacterium]|nr:DEAD/DEAH box helicase family protein [Thermoanaerobaculia bacterium]MDI9631240.1 DEAD/DEAH box helicase family protein [Acidobacteriota bacterium]MBP7812461.1 DEAD/DEAH box helicase family protein [Thermoanaerobaculia bacterium]NLN12507.1 DEAD/DEAH box helicase family protein [Acidobacteriota bacterium]HPA95284.1 DEAD/DEAH box helicase family protein [Thermoanaerobaculia bacterium]